MAANAKNVSPGPAFKKKLSLKKCPESVKSTDDPRVVKIKWSMSIIVTYSFVILHI